MLLEELNIRRGDRSDEEWLYQLFKKTMQNYIDAAWGWEELLQKEGFSTSLPARDFTVLELHGRAIACMHLSDKPDHCYLDMILVEPDYQRLGIGSKLIGLAQNRAEELCKPIVLRVLKTNPAVNFHKALGFVTTTEDEHSFEMKLESAYAASELD